jgi:hypothetical protein
MAKKNVQRDLTEDEEEAEFQRIKRTRVVGRKRDLAKWDAEIEAKLQCVVRADKAAGQSERGQRYIGSPLAFAIDVCRLTRGRTALVVALCIFRRTCIKHSLIVTLPAEELAEFNLDRQRKWKALAQLEAAKLIRIERKGTGRSVEVTLTWRPS